MQSFLEIILFTYQYFETLKNVFLNKTPNFTLLTSFRYFQNAEFKI